MASKLHSRKKRKSPAFSGPRRVVVASVLAIALAGGAYVIWPRVGHPVTSAVRSAPGVQTNQTTRAAATRAVPRPETADRAARPSIPGANVQDAMPPTKRDATAKVTPTARKMSPDAWRELDRNLVEQVKRCWTYPDTDNSTNYAPKVKVEFSRDGTISGTPLLLNPGSDPAARWVADKAMKAMSECSNLSVPLRFQAYYGEWKTRVIHFDPEL